MTAPSVQIRRRVQWMDTDAAGIWHHSVVMRWAEEAEAELHRRLGIIDETFGLTPRVRTEFDFGDALRFDDPVEITLSVDQVGDSSLTYGIEVRSGGARVAGGRIVVVLVDGETGAKRSWPPHLRSKLSPG